MNKWIWMFILCVFVIGSCSFPARKGQVENVEAGEERKEPHIDLFQVESMQVIYTDNEEMVRYLSENDRVRIGEWISDARYDEQWNDSNIMIKMIAPDYTVIIRYRDLTPEEDDWLMIWKNTGKIKYQNLWYIAGEEKTADISRLLEGYREDP